MLSLLSVTTDNNLSSWDNACFLSGPKNVVLPVGKTPGPLSHATLAWPEEAKSALSASSVPSRKSPTYLNANFMSLGGGYLNLFYAKGLACFPGDGCFAFNNLRKRERGRLII